MNALDYTVEQLQELSNEELEKLHDECQLKEDFYHIQQYVKKIMINSLYGSVGNKNFILFNEKVAQAITGNGRFLVQNTSRMINDALDSINKDKSQFVGIVYNDTDSCVGDTIIRTSVGNIKIEDLFYSSDGETITTSNGSIVKKVKDTILADSVSENFELQQNKITYIMKHSVKKRMYKIKCNGKEVIITEDHSIMVNRNGKLISVKPKDILKTDMLITI